MLRQNSNAKSTLLKESYLAISNYMRFGHTWAPNRPFCCRRDRACRIRLSRISSNPFSTLDSASNRSLKRQVEDITQGFPEPPQSEQAPSISGGNGEAHALGPAEPLDGSLPSDPGPDVPIRKLLLHERSRSDENTASQEPQEGVLDTEGDHDGDGHRIERRSRQYPYMAPFGQATHSWEMLQDIQDVKDHDVRYPVTLHGYITHTRTSSRFVDYLNFLDPKLRTMVQVMVTKRTPPDHPTTTPHDAIADGPEKHVALEVSKESETHEDTHPLNETRPKSSNQVSQSPAEHDNDNAVGDDTHSSIIQPTRVKVSNHLQSSPNTLSQGHERSLDGNKKADQNSPSHSADPVCTRYTKMRPHTPVVLHGLVCHRKRRLVPVGEDADGAPNIPLRKVGTDPDKSQRRPSKYEDQHVGSVELIDWLIIKATSITALNEMPRTIIAKSETVFPPEQRHLQLRTKHHLRQNLRLRSKAMAQTRMFMFGKGFDEIETPLLFKSTPEGAREFMVPTRREGLAYALPQSPQQYKQILMASGISRYFQFAKCFRDEDMRADRQPEFTQLDFEMSFATRAEVMFIVERLLTQMLWPSFFGFNPFQARQQNDPALRDSHIKPESYGLFARMSYAQAMDNYGSDKPDTRLGARIQRVDHYLPQNLKQMLSPLSDAVFEMIKINMHGLEPANSKKFITKFLDAPAAAPYIQNPAGAPGVTVVDPEKPLQGLASFGHEAADQVMKMLEPEVGDILIVQARQNSAHTGGSTPLGNLRRDLFQAAFVDGLLTPPTHDSFVWVVDFPLFSPVTDTDPGQGGQAGICSTHHPFTAPINEKSINLLTSDPLSCIGDHYDLVINGVEVGGGSRRIHDSKLQEFILRDVLKMKPERVEDFRHLLNALEAGCPPHAGFALGFDRLMAILTKQGSMRDVIAFPKWGDGEDKMVGAPTLMTEDQLRTYHLGIRRG